MAVCHSEKTNFLYKKAEGSEIVNCRSKQESVRNITALCKIPSSLQAFTYLISMVSVSDEVFEKSQSLAVCHWLSNRQRWLEHNLSRESFICGTKNILTIKGMCSQVEQTTSECGVCECFQDNLGAFSPPLSVGQL